MLPDPAAPTHLTPDLASRTRSNASTLQRFNVSTFQRFNHLTHLILWLRLRRSASRVVPTALSSVRASLSLLLILLSLAAPLSAATKKWSGGAGNSDWLTGSNWSPANVPTDSDDIVLDNSLTAIPSSMVVNGGDVEARTITFQAGFNGSSTTLIGGATTRSSFLTIGGPGTGVDPLIKVNSTAGTISFDRRNGGSADLSIILGAASSINVNSGATLVINCDISGFGGFAKTGSGSLRLGGTNTYAGGTAVSGGTLFLTTAGSSVCSISNSPAITVNPGAVLDVSGIPFVVEPSQTLGGSGSVAGNVTAAAGATIVAGPAGSAGTFTFSNNLSLNGATFVFDLANLTTEGGGINDEILVSGNLNLSGNNVILLNYLNGSLPTGTYKLIKFTGTKTGSFTLGASYQNVTLDEVSTPNYVTLVVSSPGSSVLNLTWKGDGVNNVWDMANSANWLEGASASVYYDSANLTLDNSGSATPAINLTATVIPSLITVNSANDYTIAGLGKIGGLPGLSNALTKNGTGVLTLGTSNEFSGGINIQAGTLKVGNPRALPSGLGKGDVSLSGTLDLNGNSITINGLSGAGAVDNNSGALTNTLTFGANDSSGNFSGIIKNTSGTLALSKAGSGTISLSGNNTFSGPATINDGALRISSASALGNATGTTTVSGGTSLARLELLGGITVNEPLALAMKFGVGAGTVDPQLPHIQNISGVNTLAGAFTLNGGGTYWTFQSDAGKLIVAPGLSSSASGGRPVLLQGVGDGEIQGSIQNGSGSVALVKSGSGTWTLSGNNSYSQSSTINAGTLRIGNANAIPTGVGKGDISVNGILDLNANSITINGLLGGGTVDNLSGVLTYVLTAGNNNALGTFSGVIKNTSGTVGLSKIGSGTLTLNGNNTYTGNTTVSAGTLRVNGSLASGAVTVNASATLGGSGTINGPVTVQNGGSLSPGSSIGTLTVNGVLALSGATLMEINKTGGTLTSDLVKGISTLTYGGTLTVIATGDPLAQNDTFNLFDATTFAGSFATLNLPGLPPCLAWDTSKLATDGTIRVVDPTSPVIDCSTNLSLLTTNPAGVAVSFAVTASDLCSGAITPVCSPASSSNFPIGTTTVNCTATDPNNNSSACSFSVTVVQNHLPVAGNNTLGAFSNHTRKVSLGRFLANDSDADGDALTITAVSTTSSNGGTITLTGTDILYRSATNFLGADMFTYTLSDGRGGTATGSVFVQVHSPNDPSVNRITAGSSDGILHFAGIPGMTYTVERSTDLAIWAPIGAFTASEAGFGDFQDPHPPSDSAFYRTSAPE